MKVIRLFLYFNPELTRKMNVRKAAKKLEEI